MGLRGPLPKPKQGAPKLKFSPGIAGPPSILDAVGKKEYSRITSLMKNAGSGYLQRVDMSMVTIYCANWSRVVKLTGEIEEEGVLLQSIRTGAYYQNPKVSMLQAAEAKLLECSKRLGFSPYDRRRIEGEIGDEEKGNPILERMAKKKVTKKKTAARK